MNSNINESTVLKNWLLTSMSRSPFCGGIFDWDTIDERLAELNHRSEDPELWEEPAVAQKVMRERQLLEKQTSGFRQLEQELEDACTLIELGEMEGDAEIVTEAETALKALVELAAQIVDDCRIDIGRSGRG